MKSQKKEQKIQKCFFILFWKAKYKHSLQTCKTALCTGWGGYFIRIHFHTTTDLSVIQLLFVGFYAGIRL